MRDASLEAAYQATDYIVDHPSGQFCIHIGESCPAIEAREWAYVTACNPQSKLLLPQENSRRMHTLEQALSAERFRFLRGEARSRDGKWPPEPSLLIVDIAENAAIELARRFDQAAIVVGRAGELARLAWIDDCSPADSA